MNIIDMMIMRSYGERAHRSIFVMRVEIQVIFVFSFFD